ncbi:hypothetical protein D5F01_LYC11161 [Larimichthys crocea]|uniref:Uncharacterized protein n=1 Tax=Larimichthys crocea TaxID=215358 RepID=A0A6G0IDE8_LARCR|nr:hypothetical protein D5F01_LYC11161 [Larimichthys crocea]
MLLKVKYQNTKKYIRLLSGFTFLDFIAQVKYKFGLPDATELDAFDETNTVVEEDIFSELIEASPDLCLTVRDRIPDADTNTSLSSSDNDHSSRIEHGTPIGRRTSSQVIPRPTREVSESEAAKELNQDFLLLFGAETASKMLEKWDTTFRPKVINEARHLTQSVEVCRLLKAAEKLTENDDTTWDSDMASLLLLLHLLPPTAGRKRTKISPSDAVDKMFALSQDPSEQLKTLQCKVLMLSFCFQSCCSLDEHLRGRDGRQPYILAVGRTRNRIDTFYIVVDKQLIPCQATSSLGAFDELFKSHYVFNLSYDECLGQLFTFVQTTVYNIDVATTKESPRVREFRAKVFN